MLPRSKNPAIKKEKSPLKKAARAAAFSRGHFDL
jgi:hypothetical protein